MAKTEKFPLYSTCSLKSDVEHVGQVVGVEGDRRLVSFTTRRRDGIEDESWQDVESLQEPQAPENAMKPEER